MQSYDTYILDKREEIYKKNRKNLFIKMYLKHYKKECSCMKTNKICQCEILNIDFSDLSRCYDSGMLDTIYNINQSITQSQRSIAGKIFEDLIEETLILEKISYSRQVLIGTHKVDFTIPTYTDNFKGYIISCKTTLRERMLQDSYLKNEHIKVITLTTEKRNDESIICINKEL